MSKKGGLSNDIDNQFLAFKEHKSNRREKLLTYNDDIPSDEERIRKIKTKKEKMKLDRELVDNPIREIKKIFENFQEFEIEITTCCQMSPFKKVAVQVLDNEGGIKIFIPTQTQIEVYPFLSLNTVIFKSQQVTTNLYESNALFPQNLLPDEVVAARSIPYNSVLRYTILEWDTKSKIMFNDLTEQEATDKITYLEREEEKAISKKSRKRNVH
eukprot:TRINITY_DN640_c0_g1_i2.p1 TRINITY_DN640_c0_g1~~TRINITY_DN640_c0_g1_i2.p1  ORF type:complete len:213 (-),score=29.98 TRINITY_DN640_c0_g1_i2:262-900(-)